MLATITEKTIIWDSVDESVSFDVEALGQISRKPVYTAVKRLFDLLASAMLMILLCIPMLVLTALILLDSPGNPFYSQIRLGKDEKPFKLYKFRSMVRGAEETGARWAEKDDPRVTKIGRWLRKTRMDELPQLLNIFLGQMSFVGPRPERPEFYAIFDQYIHGFRQRMAVTPGLTGLAQVNGGYDLRPEEKIIYDIEYIKTRSLWVDLGCILKTVQVVFTYEGAR